MIKFFHLKVNDKNEFQISLKKKVDNKTSLMWGTYRSLINNAVLVFQMVMKKF